MSGDNVINAGMLTNLPTPVERVLQAAIEANLAEVIVVGMEQQGSADPLYISTSESDTDRLIALLEIAKAHLLDRRMKHMGLR